MNSASSFLIGDSGPYMAWALMMSRPEDILSQTPHSGTLAAACEYSTYRPVSPHVYLFVTFPNFHPRNLSASPAEVFGETRVFTLRTPRPCGRIRSPRTPRPMGHALFFLAKPSELKAQWSLCPRLRREGHAGGISGLSPFPRVEVALGPQAFCFRTRLSTPKPESRSRRSFLARIPPAAGTRRGLQAWGSSLGLRGSAAHFHTSPGFLSLSLTANVEF